MKEGEEAFDGSVCLCVLVVVVLDGVVEVEASTLEDVEGALFPVTISTTSYAIAAATIAPHMCMCVCMYGMWSGSIRIGNSTQRRHAWGSPCAQQ
jgi:hypothetical protein